MAFPGGEPLFLDLRASGAQELEKLFPQPPYFIAHINGAAVPDKAALMAALAAAFRFPAYFGGNWDALLDCLRSLPDELPARGYVIAIAGSERFLSSFREDRENFSDIAGDARQFLAEKFKIPFRIVLL